MVTYQIRLVIEKRTPSSVGGDWQDTVELNSRFFVDNDNQVETEKSFDKACVILEIAHDASKF